MNVRYLTPASLGEEPWRCLGRISCNVGPLCISLISILLCLAKSRHICTSPLALGTRTKLLHHFNVSSTPRTIIICCFCSLSSSILREFPAAHMLLSCGMPGITDCHPSPVSLTCLQCYVGQYMVMCLKISLIWFSCLGVIILHFILCTAIHNCLSSGSLFFTSLRQNN